MPEDAQEPVSDWLVAPAGPHDVWIRVELGEGAELSDEARAALDTFVAELHAADVEGFALPPKCVDLDACRDFLCTLSTCKPLSRRPCAWDEQCSIMNLF